MSNSPLVSVVITTYNRPEFLVEAVETVAAQTYEPIELIVVDDCSEIPATEVLSDTAPDVSAMNIIRHDENRGANGARNTGVEAATGTYIAFLDDDDRWVSDKIERQVDVIQTAADDVGLVYTGRKRVDGDTVREEVIPEEITADTTKTLLCENVVGTQSSILVRASIAKSVPFDERLPRWADMEWYISVSKHCEFTAIQEPLVLYDRTAHNRISEDSEKLKESYTLFVEKFRDLASEYGWLFERKMIGYAKFRAGHALFNARNYSEARAYFAGAIATYPFESRFYVYAAAASGGRVTHETARATRSIVSKLTVK